MKNLDEALELLGCKGVDKVTKSKGVITCVSFDLYGCIQVVITPEVNKEGKKEDSHWYDVQRIKVTNKIKVMKPEFKWYKENSSKGSAEKPALNKEG